MLKRSAAQLIVAFAVIIVTVAPASGILAGYAQLPTGLVAERMIDTAQRASERVKALVDSVYADEDALRKIADVNLMEAFEGNASLYDQGVVLLDDAKNAFAEVDYEAAVASAREAMQFFREAYRSINWILLDAGLRFVEADASSLLEAAAHTLDQIERLKEVLPSNSTAQMELLDQAKALIEEIEGLILVDKRIEAVNNLDEARQLISQVYEYLKVQAQESNAFRIRSYLGSMEQERERLRERFRYAESLGLNVDSIFESLGYHNETEFMNALQNMTQNAESQTGNLTRIMGDLEELSQLVQQMNQTLTQEMNRYQHQHGQGGGSTQSPGTSSGPSVTDSRYGSGSTGTSSNGADSGLGGSNNTSSDTSQSGYASGSSGNSSTPSGAGNSGTSGAGTGSDSNGATGPQPPTSGPDSGARTTSGENGYNGP